MTSSDYRKLNRRQFVKQASFATGTKEGEVNWIVETKGRIWPGTNVKYEATTDWCERISERTDINWRFAPVNQTDFDRRKPKTLDEITGLVSGDEATLI